MATDLGKTRTASAARYDSFVASQLAQAERRIRTLDLTAALLGWLAVALAYLVFMVLLDSKLDLSDATRRTALYCFLAGSVAYSWLFILRPLRRRINPYYAARKVEELLPDAKNSVVNWVDLHNEKLPPVIRGALGHRAARDLGQVDMQQAISGRRTGWTGGMVGLGVVAFLVCFFALGPTPFFSFLKRTFSPFSSTPAATRTRLTILSPEGGDTVLTVGRPFAVTVEVQGRVPDARGEDALKLQYRYEEDEPFLERLLQQDSGREWKGSLSARDVENGFWYRVVGGDAATPVYRVKVQSAPALTAFLATYRFRPYVGRADEVSRQRELHGVRGTEVILRARTNRRLREAQLDFVSKTRLQSVPGTVSGADAQNLEVRFVLEEEGQYRLRFTSDGGETYLDPRFYSVVVSPDQAPVVELTRPGSDVSMPANGLLRLEGKANDDFGIKSMVLRMQVTGGLQLAARPYREKALALEAGGFPREVPYKDFVDLSGVKSEEGQSVSLKPGMDLEYWLEASDACDLPKPNVGESKHYHVHIAEPDRSDRKNLDQQRQQAEKEKRQHQAQQDRKLQKESQARQQERQEQQERNQEEERKSEEAQQQGDKGQGDQKQSNGKEDGKGDKSDQGQGQDKQGGAGQDDKKKDDASAKGEQGGSDKKDDKQGDDKGDKQEPQGGTDSKQNAEGDKGDGKGDKGEGQDRKDGGLSKEQQDLLKRAEESLKKEQQKGDKSQEKNGQGSGNDTKPDKPQGDKKSDGQDKGTGDKKQQGGKPDDKPGSKPAGDSGDKRQDAKGKPEGDKGTGDDKGKPEGDKGAGNDKGKPEGDKGKPDDKSTDAANPGSDKKGKPEPGDKGKPQGDKPDGDKAKPQGGDKPAGDKGKPQGDKSVGDKTDGGEKGKPEANPSDTKGPKEGSEDKPAGGKTQPGNPSQPKGGKDGGEASKEDIDKLMKDLRSQDAEQRKKTLDSLEKASKEVKDPKARQASKELLERGRELDKLLCDKKSEPDPDAKSNTNTPSDKGEGNGKGKPDADKGKPGTERTGNDKGKPGGDKGAGAEKGKPGEDKGKPEGDKGDKGTGDKSGSNDKGKPDGDKGAGDKAKPKGGDKGQPGDKGAGGEKGQPGGDKGKPGDKGKSGDKGKPQGDKETDGQKGDGQESGKPGAGNNPGNGAPGQRRNDGAAPPGTPRKPGNKTANPRDTMMQLEKLDRDALRKVLKDANISPEDWEKFREAYRRQKSKEGSSKQETIPGHQQGGGALPTFGGKVKSEGKVEGASNRAQPPPQYRSSFREFNRRLSDLDADSK